MNQERAQLQQRKELLFAELTYLNDSLKTKLSPQLTLPNSKYSKLEGLTVTFTQLFNEISVYNSRVHISQQIPMEDYYTFLELIGSIRSAFFEAEEMEIINNSAPVPPYVPEFPYNYLPLFDGTIQRWPDFKNIFDSMIHYDTSLPEETKLQFLKSIIRGDAASTICNFDLTKENYWEAYDLLHRYYHNARNLGNAYLQSLLKFCFMPFNPRKFYCHHKAAVDALRSLNIKDLGEYILFQICYNNLDFYTQRAFDLKWQNKEKMPSAGDVLDFVLSIANAMESGADALAEGNDPTYYFCGQMRAMKLEKLNKKFCTYCRQSHFIAFCTGFRNNSVEKRLEFVLQHRLCTNCLGPHDLMLCWSKKTCHVCSQKHHTLLHALLVSFYYTPPPRDVTYELGNYPTWSVMN